jgi:N-acetylmuramoyl-L-alanine amidase
MTPLPDAGKSLYAQDPCILLGVCIWGESRGQSFETKFGVASVVRNRVISGRYGDGYTGVILKPKQFSCFNADDPNESKLLNPLKYDSQRVWDEAFTASYLVMYGHRPDTTRGAVFYFGPPLVSSPKAWGSVIHTATIGALHFYAEPGATISKI